MKIRYYSEELDKYFDSEKEAVEAELTKKRERDKAEKNATEKDKRLKEVMERVDEANKVVERYQKDYGGCGERGRCEFEDDLIGLAVFFDLLG